MLGNREPTRAKLRVFLGSNISDVVLDLVMDAVVLTWVIEGSKAGHIVVKRGSLVGSGEGHGPGSNGVKTGSKQGHDPASNGVKTGSKQGHDPAPGQKSDLTLIRSSLFSSPGSASLEASSLGKVNMMSPPGFNEFWSAFWRRVKKAKAIQAWAKLAPDPTLTQVIVNAVKGQTAEQMTRDPQYRPHAATWLNGREWENEIAPATAKPVARNFTQEANDQVRLQYLQQVAAMEGK